MSGRPRLPQPMARPTSAEPWGHPVDLIVGLTMIVVAIVLMWRFIGFHL